MSVENNWRSLDGQTDELLSSLLSKGQFQKLHSQNPLMKIKRQLILSGFMATILSVLYTFLLINYPFWQLLVCIGILLLFTAAGAYTSFKYAKSIQPFINAEGSLLQEMEKHYFTIKKWGDIQMKAAILVYPFAAAGGFMLGGMLGSGKSIEFFMSKPKVIVILIITISILVPLSLWLAKFLFNKSFGIHLKKLKAYIDELKS